jgi:aspartyl-tRNA(Asn)/glutamyl-tRNA(Gln) amidotransferase subunit B
LPEARQQRFVREYVLPEYDAAQLTASKRLADYFEEVAKKCSETKLAANWMSSELLYLLKEANKQIEQSPVSSSSLADLLTLLKAGTISGKMGKDILAEMFASGKVAREIMAANPKQVEQYRKGKAATLGWFVGQVMKATRGQANPQLVQEVLKKELG